MKTVSVTAHLDGKHVQLDKSPELELDTVLQNCHERGDCSETCYGDADAEVEVFAYADRGDLSSDDAL